MTPLVRDARPHEHDDIGRLLVDVYGGEKLVAPSYLSIVADSASRASAADLDVMVAFLPGSPRIAGTVALAHPGGRYSYGDTPDEPQVRMLAVSRAARGHGVGSALVSECVARAMLRGYSALSLDTVPTMVDAQRLYSRLDFDRAPSRDGIARSGDAMVAYVKALTPWPLVREAAADEYDTVGELTAAAYLHSGLTASSSPYVADLRDAKRRAAEARVLVAVDRSSGSVVGTVTYCPDGSPWHEIAAPDEGEFRMLGVSPAARGQGVGEALSRACLASAVAEGKRAVVLSSSQRMAAAHRLYARLGFERTPERDWSPTPEFSLLTFVREV